MWRGAGAWSHAPGRSTAGASHESDKSDEPVEARDNDNYDVDNHDHCDANDYDDESGDYDYDDYDSPGQYTVTASCMKWST